MAHRTTSYTYRPRTLAAPPSSDTPNNNTSSMDPTPTIFHLPPSPTTPTTRPHYPDPPSSSSTIHSISNHFSKLYTNHKTLSSSSLRPSSGPPIDTHLQARPMMSSSTTSSHSSTASLTKSFSQRRPQIGKEGRKGFRVKDKVYEECDEGPEIKREIISSKFDEVPKEFSKKERDFLLEGGHKSEVIKKPYFSMATNQEIVAVKELREGYHELKRQSFSSSLGVSGGRRSSFCSSQAQLANFLSCNGVKVVAVDMAPFMQIHAVDCARKTHDSLEKFTAKTLALTLKKEFDGVYGPAWHCIVGTSFGSFVTYSVGGFLYFSMDQKHYVLLFKTTVQKAS